jgi:hypothetical protein
MSKYASKYVGAGATPSGWIKVGNIVVDFTGTGSATSSFIPGIIDSYDNSGYVIISDTTTAGLVGRSTGGGTGTASANTPTYWMTSAKTDESFLSLAKRLTGSQSLASASDAKNQLNNNGYWTSWVAVAASYLLDTYGGAVYAYSLRKLSSTYTGYAIRVRRSSDNTEQDIGFDSNGDLDTSSLLSFVGAGDGYVTVWYDQSGPFVEYYTGHASLGQSSAVSQPQIVSSGVLITDNGKPSILLDGSNDSMSIAYDRGYTWNDATFVFVSSQLTGDSNFGRLLDNNYSDGFWFGRNGTSNQAGGGWAQASSPYGVFKPVNDNTQFLMFAYRIGSTGQTNLAVNNSTISSNITTSGNISTQLTLGAWGWGQTAYGKKKVQEIILYPNDKSVDRTSISDAINTYYSIY